MTVRRRRNDDKPKTPEEFVRVVSNTREQYWAEVFDDTWKQISPRGSIRGAQCVEMWTRSSILAACEMFARREVEEDRMNRS
jgi:hypothetical protein